MVAGVFRFGLTGSWLAKMGPANVALANMAPANVVLANGLGLAALALLLASGPVAHGQAPSVDRLFPPAVTRGAETLVTAEGKFDKWPVQVWCDREDVQCRTEEKSGMLTFTVAEDAPPGIAWVRFHNPQGASALVPLLIETTAVTVEAEPNNAPGQATAAELPAALVGRLDKANDVDCYQFSLTAGQVLVADVTAHRILGSPMDAVLQLVDEGGNVLAQSDDARGIDPQIVFPCQRDGQYVLRLVAFPETPTSTIGFAGAATFVYRLHATTGPLLDHAFPLIAPAEGDVAAAAVGWNLAQAEPLVTAATAISPPIVSLPGALGWQPRPQLPELSGAVVQTLAAGAEVTAVDQVPALLSGHIAAAGQTHRLQVKTKAGGKYRVTVHSQASGLKLDSVVTVINPADGKQLARNDDASGTNRDAVTTFTAPAGELTEVQISDLVGGFGLSHGFSVAITPLQPAVGLSVAADRFSVAAADGTVEIPVTVQRQDGYSEVLDIVAIDLPEGVTAEAVQSQAKGDSAKEVKLKLVAKAATAHQGPIRIVARPPGDAEAAAVAEARFTLRAPFSTTGLWLSVTP